MAYSKKAQSTYDKKIVQFKTKYSLSELQDGERVKAYLEQTGQSANSYIKALIKADLDAKGFSVSDNDNASPSVCASGYTIPSS